MAPATIEEAERLWLAGRPLEAGRVLTALVPPGRHPRWAGRVLDWAYARSRVPAIPEVEATIAAIGEAPEPNAVEAAYRGVDAALLRAERAGRFDSLHEAVLTLARNAARLALAAATPGPPDPRDGWWFVASLKCVGDELDERFTAEAWTVLAQLDP